MSITEMESYLFDYVSTMFFTDRIDELRDAYDNAQGLLEDIMIAREKELKHLGHDSVEWLRLKDQEEDELAISIINGINKTFNDVAIPDSKFPKIDNFLRKRG